MNEDDIEKCCQLDEDGWSIDTIPDAKFRRLLLAAIAGLAHRTDRLLAALEKQEGKSAE